MAVVTVCTCDGDDCEVQMYPTYHTEDERTYCGECYDTLSDQVEELTAQINELTQIVADLRGQLEGYEDKGVAPISH